MTYTNPNVRWEGVTLRRIQWLKVRSTNEVYTNPNVPFTTIAIPGLLLRHRQTSVQPLTTETAQTGSSSASPSPSTCSTMHVLRHHHRLTCATCMFITISTCNRYKERQLHSVGQLWDSSTKVYGLRTRIWDGELYHRWDTESADN